jgi:DNA-binding CsgD family transcriptional regulator
MTCKIWSELSKNGQELTIHVPVKLAVEYLYPKPTKRKLVARLDRLSLRQREIFDLLVIGKQFKEIASSLHIARRTVKFHVPFIYQKLNLQSHEDLLRIYGTATKKELNSRIHFA